MKITIPKEKRKPVVISVDITPTILILLYGDILKKMAQAEDRGEEPTMIVFNMPKGKILGLRIVETEP